jgi:hypothetical protein
MRRFIPRRFSLRGKLVHVRVFGGRDKLSLSGLSVLVAFAAKKVNTNECSEVAARKEGNENPMCRTV